jgi:hypothetical protein
MMCRVMLRSDFPRLCLALLCGALFAIHPARGAETYKVGIK